MWTLTGVAAERWRRALRDEDAEAREEIVEATVEVPAGWRPEELPAPVAVESDDVQARCEWAFRDGRLSYRRSSRHLVPRIPPDRYGAFRADVKRLQAADRTERTFRVSSCCNTPQRARGSGPARR